MEAKCLKPASTVEHGLNCFSLLQTFLDMELTSCGGRGIR